MAATATIRVEGAGSTLLSERTANIPVAGSATLVDSFDGDTNTVSNQSATSLLVRAVLDATLPVGFDVFNFGGPPSTFITRIGADTMPQDYSIWWKLKVNHMAAQVGTDDITVRAGDEVLWTFGTGTEDELAVTGPTAPQQVGTPFTVPDPATSMRVVDIASRAVRNTENKEKIEVSLPNSANAGQYGKNRVIKTTSGFVFELDDTPGSARAQLHHPTGAGIEINDAGVKTERWTKSWTEVADAATTRIGGDERVRVDGHSLESVGKNKIEDIQGRLVLLAKEIQLQSRLDLMFEASAIQMKARGRTRFDHIGGLEVAVGDAYNLSATSVSMSSLGSLAFFSSKSANLTGLTGVNLSTAVGLPQLRLSALGVDISPFGVGRSVAMADAVVAALGLILTHTHTVTPDFNAKPSEVLAAGLPGAIAAVTSTNLRAL
jgi:hypothetical protein